MAIRNHLVVQEVQEQDQQCRMWLNDRKDAIKNGFRVNHVLAWQDKRRKELNLHVLTIANSGVIRHLHDYQKLDTTQQRQRSNRHVSQRTSAG